MYASMRFDFVVRTNGPICTCPQIIRYRVHCDLRQICFHIMRQNPPPRGVKSRTWTNWVFQCATQHISLDIIIDHTIKKMLSLSHRRSEHDSQKLFRLVHSTNHAILWSSSQTTRPKSTISPSKRFKTVSRRTFKTPPDNRTMTFHPNGNNKRSAALSRTGLAP
jgi:hypothetical protein